jgi:murein DD-endopeptidase MepM/ murein hydrolase activator NlpD
VTSPDRPSVSSAPLAAPEAKPAPAVAVPTPPPTVPEAPDYGRPVTPPVAGGSAFLWPVRGHILATYGTKSDGSHNDGINIAAPRGTAVEAVDAGVVAYTGNELRGYGNLVLVKHANGWISAYAHCDQVLVKRGEKVARGQAIARVGSTGNVSEPQLHFELRRGQHAVDPREFLTPSPTAAAKESRSS